MAALAAAAAVCACLNTPCGCFLSSVQAPVGGATCCRANLNAVHTSCLCRQAAGLAATIALGPSHCCIGRCCHSQSLHWLANSFAGKLLDWVLGGESALFQRGQLKALVSIHAEPEVGFCLAARRPELGCSPYLKSAGSWLAGYCPACLCAFPFS